MIQHLMDANASLRRVKKHRDVKLSYRPDFNPWEGACLCVHDAGFDNAPGHKSQRGHMLLFGAGEIISDHKGRHQIHPIAWQSSRITRAVRSTLSAEAYSC